MNLYQKSVVSLYHLGYMIQKKTCFFVFCETILVFTQAMDGASQEHPKFYKLKVFQMETEKL